MGWTRNAQNIVYTNCATTYSPLTASGFWGFGDGTPWTVKTPDNNIYTVGVDAGYSTSWSNSTVTGNGLLQTWASAGVLNFTPPSISSSSPVGTVPSSNNSIPIACIRFGSGDSNESFEDCNLSGQILNCSGYCMSSSIYYAGNGTFGVSMRYAITAKEDVTIKEWGLFSTVGRDDRRAECLTYRKKISPIELESGHPFSIDINIVFPKLEILGEGWTRNAQNALYSRAFIRSVYGTEGSGYNDFTDEYPWILKVVNGSRMMAMHNWPGGSSSTTGQFMPLNIGSGAMSVTEINVADQSHSGGVTTDPWPSSCIVFGSGSTPQTFEDYCIESFVPCQKIQSSFQVVSNGNGGFKIFGNIIAAPIENATIQEWALYDRMTFYRINNPNAYASYMIYRKVFDEPITVRAGQSFSMNIEFDLPKLSIS